jgi:hypothetical protein
MPGRWILDDSQSLFYLDDDESSVESGCETDPFPAQRPGKHHPDKPSSSPRHRKKTAKRRTSSTLPELGGIGSRAHRSASSDSTGQLSFSPDAARQLLRLNSSPYFGFGQAAFLDQTFVQPLTGLNLVMGYNTCLPMSRLDVYITALRQFVRCCAESYALA